MYIFSVKRCVSADPFVVYLVNTPGAMTSISGTCGVIDILILVWEIDIHTVKEVNLKYVYFQCEKMCFRRSICRVSGLHTYAMTSISGTCSVIDILILVWEIDIYTVKEVNLKYVYFQCEKMCFRRSICRVSGLHTCVMTSISGTCSVIGILILVWEIDIRTV